MNRKKKTILAVASFVALAAVTVAGVLVSAGQGAATGSEGSGTATTSFLSRVAKNLGIEESRLTQAIQTAREQGIDEALAAGRITAEQAQAMKERLTVERAMDELIADGIAAGKITQAQADLVGGQRAGRMSGRPGRGGMGREASGMCPGPLGGGMGR